MKKGLIITFIICAVLFALGVVMVIAGWKMGAATDFDIDLVNRRIHSVNEKNMKSGEVETGVFSDIDIDMSASDVNIIEGDSFKVVYKVYEEAPEIKNDNGKLIIKEKENSKKFRFHLGFEELDDSHVDIFIPKGTAINECKVDINAGDLLIETQTMAKLDVDTDAGNIKINESELGDALFKSNAGNLSLNDTKADKIDGDVDYGNFKIEDSEITDLTLDTDAGNTKIEKTRINNVDIKADAGNVKLDLIGEMADYSIDAKADFGNLKIDGEKQGNKFSVEGKSGKSIKVNANAGNIDIDF